MLSNDAIEKITEYARGRRDIVAIYVFGSVATGRDRCGSDIDLAIMCRGVIKGMERIDMETALSNLLHRDVDLVVFGDSSSLLQHQILKYGRLIYESHPRERIRQEVPARRAYLDEAHLHKELEKSKAHGG